MGPRKASMVHLLHNATWVTPGSAPGQSLYQSVLQQLKRDALFVPGSIKCLSVLKLYSTASPEVDKMTVTANGKVRHYPALVRSFAA